MRLRLSDPSAEQTLMHRLANGRFPPRVYEKQVIMDSQSVNITEREVFEVLSATSV